MFLKKIKNFLTKENLIEITKTIILAAIIILPIRIFIMEPYMVIGKSMSPSFETGNYLLINKFSHKNSEVERGSIMVFQSPNSDKDYIKRIVGLPNESILIEEGKVFIKKTNDGIFEELKEPYVENFSFKDQPEILVEENEYYVLGDNRSNSLDSRYFGSVSKESFKGEPFFRLYPFSLSPSEYKNFNID